MRPPSMGRKVRKEVIGMATLYLGDCLEVMPTLPKVDAVITDPPYGIGFAGSSTKDSPTPTGVTYLSFNDTPENIRDLIVPRFEAALAIASRAAITPGIANHRMYPNPSAEGVFWYPSGANSGPWGFVTHQPIFYYGACPFLARGKGRRATGKQATTKAEENGHPCPKPIDQITWLVNRASWADEIVLDPFMGSGTTGVACANLGRRFIGIEIEPKCFDIACQRIENAYRQERMFA
jgi:site-specific DNA-methyltransferase (adenine-specific)